MAKRKVKPTEDVTEELTTAAIDTAEHIQENVSNLPVITVALAGLVGAGVLAFFKPFSKQQKI